MGEEVRHAVAIIGLAGRFPGAADLDAFWRNIRDGVESVEFFTEADTAREGELPHPSRHDPNFVRARARISHRLDFDARFFGIPPREAELLDPQHRVFLECAWEALENAGYDPERYPGAVGVYAGCYLDSYIFTHLSGQPNFLRDFTSNLQVGSLSTELTNDKDHIATRTAFKLNLRGPAINVQTACSTSLVAVSQAVHSLLTFQCDMALAGASTVTFRRASGYLHDDGGMLSADGHCRAYDHRASGTIFGEGCGVVLLKRLEEALADGDHITAVIRAAALNNDGANKVSYAAPSVEGETEVITLAHAIAGIDPGTITYLEGHGTGTPLGDPIEVRALTEAFRAGTSRLHFCALGSLKPNIGHLDTASGVAGLIKASLALRHRTIPPLANFEAPNPAIDSHDSPFYFPKTASPWTTEDGTPRRAGVSSFGVGGTNAHVVLEEAPTEELPPSSRPAHLLIFSAKTPAALDALTTNFANHLQEHPTLSLADAAYTLQVGRREWNHRRTVVGRSVPDAIAALRNGNHSKANAETVRRDLPVVFMFPGQGSQYLDMGAELYAQEPVFRAEMDRCAEFLSDLIGVDLREVIYSKPGADKSNASDRLTRTAIAQPALFATEYAMARLWMSWGIEPAAMVGHSVGEFVAGCLAGVFSLEDALRLIATRGRLVEEMPPGSMLAVRLSESAVLDRLSPHLDIAAINSSQLTVVAGPLEHIASFENELSHAGEIGSRLETSHAFHSASMAPVVPRFAEAVSAVHLHPPRIPYVSTATGTWVRPEEATDPGFWAQQVRLKVRFADAIRTLFENRDHVFLEVGPGITLKTLALQDADPAATPTILASLPGARNSRSREVASCLQALGQLWQCGCSVDWESFHHHEPRRRVPLPTYPFERQRYAIEPRPFDSTPAEDSAPGIESVAAPLDEPATGPDASPASLRSELAQKFHGLSGIPISESEYHTSFISLGFDSLLLSQARQAVQAAYGIRVSFRQFIDELNHIEALARHLEAVLPPEAASKVKPAKPGRSASASAPTTAISDGNAQAILQELATIKRELSTMRFARGSASDSGATMKRFEPAGAPPEGAPRTSHGPFKPIDRGKSEGLTRRQSAALQQLVARYNQRTSGSKALTETHRPHFCDPRAAGNFRQMWKEMVYPIVCERSKGARIWDIDGNEYIDVTLGFGVHFLGHSPDYVIKAVKAQLEKGTEIGPQSPIAGEVARMITEFTGLDRVTFCNTGSEAVMAAMRVARTATGRNKIVMFSGDYHGMFDSVLTRGFKVDGEWKTAPIAPGIPQSQVDDMFVLEFNSEESLAFILARADEIAAVIVEPVQARHPSVQARDFLHALRGVTRERGIVYVFDEVITGFRCAPGGAQEYFGVRADLATYGKIVGGGMPIGVLAGRAELMDVLDGGQWQYGDDSFPEAAVTFFAGTFVRHPLAIAAAHAVLKHLKAEGPALQQRVSEQATQFAARLNDLFQELGVPMRVENFCSLMHYELDPKWEFAGLIFYYLREQGVHIWEGRLGFISAAHSAEDLELLYQHFRSAAKAMRDDGFLPIEATLPPGAVPLTPAQQEVWIASQISEAASNAFIESDSLRLRGPLDAARLNTALRKVVARHDSLRGRFAPGGEGQFFDPVLEPSIQEHDLTALSADARETRLNEFTSAEVGRSFDLVHGPLFRVHLFRLETEAYHLLFVAHHLACDGWSIDIFFRELAELYSAATEMREPQLAEPMQYIDYVRLCADQAKDSAEDQRYWVDRFREIPPPLELPLDLPRTVLRTWDGARAIRKLGAELRTQAGRVAVEQGTTLFSFLLAAFQALIHRLSGSQEFVVGIYAAGQTAPGAESLVGHCVSTLPLCQRVEFDSTFGALLKSSRNTLLDAFEHKEFTLGRLLEVINIPREPNRPPLVSVVFNVDPRLETTSFAGLNHSHLGNPRRYYQFDLGLNIVDEPGGLRLECDYNPNLFTGSTVERWLGYFENILCAVIKDPLHRLATLPLISHEERSWLLAWGRNPQPENHSPVHEMIEAQVNATPSAIAIRQPGSDEISYASLWERSALLAAHLRHRGVGHGKLVGIALERTPNLVVAVLAVLRCGAGYVPMDPDYPSTRLAAMIEDSHMALIVTQSSLSESLPGPDTPRLLVDSLGDTQPPAFRKATVRPADTAYVIFTSGSTGRPKGVTIPHRALSNFIESMRRQPGCTQDDVILAVTTLSFDIAGLELLLPLTVGAQIALASRETASDPYALGQALEDSKATIMQATPATWHSLIAIGWLGHLPRKILVGGEAFSPDLANALMPRCAELWNMYGPTETTIWSTIERIRPPVNSFVIGKPIANTTTYVLSTSQELQPTGVVGELFIGGLGLADGYLQQPELTAEKFVRDPIAAEPDTRVFRTGDLARWNADGRLECLGRVDQQLKIRGFRVERGEVEAALRSHPAIEEAAVHVRRLSHGDDRLVAYYTSQGGTTEHSLRAHLGTSLPAYMIPSLFVRLTSLPLTPNGKVDYKALPDPSHSAADSTPALAANSVQRQLVELWQELLGTKSIGIHDDFFHLGGHSLLAARMIAAVKERFGVQVPLQTLFERADVAHLSEVLIRCQKESAAAEPLTTLHSGKEPGIFFFHGDFVGGGFFTHELARTISPGHSFHAVHPHGFAGEAIPPTIEAMALERLEHVRRIQPHGPYTLGGYCNGALVAYEVARLLEASGEKVEALVMLNADGTQYRYRHLHSLAAITSRLRSESEVQRSQRFIDWSQRIHFTVSSLRFYRVSLGVWSRYPWPQKWQRGRRKVGRVIQRMLGKSALNENSRSPLQPDPAQKAVSEAYHRASNSYIPKPVNARVILLWSECERLPNGLSPESGWSDVCANTELHLVPGDHHTCVADSRHLGSIGKLTNGLLTNGPEPAR